MDRMWNATKGGGMLGNTMVADPATTEIRLLESLQRRDSAAWDEFYRAHEGRVYGFAYRLTGNAHDAADLTQETFVRVLARIDRLEADERGFAPYLLTTTRNLFLKGLERGRRQHVTAEVPEPDEPLPIDDDPERAALLSQQREEVRRANAELPESQRTVLALREVEGQSYAEIGEVVGMNENAVAQAIFRARQALRRALRMAAVDLERMPDACRGRLPELSTHLDGRVKGAKREELQMHLARCEYCRAAFSDMNEAQRRYRLLLPPAAVLPALRESIHGAAEAAGFVAGGSTAQGVHAAPSAVRRLLGHKAIAGVSALAVGALLALLLWPGDSTAVSPWERIDRAGIEASARVAAINDGSRVSIAWRRADHRLDLVTADSSTDDATHNVERARPAGDQSVWTSPAFLADADGSTRLAFTALSPPLPAIFGTTNRVRSGWMSTRADDGSWSRPAEIARGNIFEDARFEDGAVLPDGTPVWPWVGSATEGLGRGIGVGLPRLEVPLPAYAAHPRLGADRAGRLWLAAVDDDGLLIMRLDPRTLARAGRLWRAPAYDGSWELACAATCRLVYVGGGDRDGEILSWAPDERAPTPIARPGSLENGVIAAAYRPDGRLYVAWHDDGTADPPRRPGVVVQLGDERGVREGRVLLPALPRPSSGRAVNSLTLAPSDHDVLVVANVRLDEENQVHASRVRVSG